MNFPILFSSKRKILSNTDDLVKSQKSDDKVKSFRCKVRKSEGMRRTYVYAGVIYPVNKRYNYPYYFHLTASLNINEQNNSQFNRVGMQRNTADGLFTKSSTPKIYIP